MKKIILIGLILISILGLNLLFAKPAFATVCHGCDYDTCKNTHKGIYLSAPFTDVTCVYGTNMIKDYIKQIRLWARLVVGVLAIVMIIISGFRYMLAGGEEKTIEGAKNALVYAVTGIILWMVMEVILTILHVW